MGKKQHQKDKMYLTTTEWSTLYGGKKTDNALRRNNTPASFLDQFSRLAEFDASTRLSAVAQIIQLVSEQYEDSPTKSSTSQEVENDDGNNFNGKLPDIGDRRGYALKRLLRGLASSNKCARIGFSDALAELLRRIHYSSEEILETMNETLSLQSKEDRSQMMIGRLLAWGSIIRAGRISPLLSDCVNELLSLAEREFLESVVCRLFGEMLSSVDEVSFGKVWPIIECYLTKKTGDATPLSAYLVMLIRRHQPKRLQEPEELLPQAAMCSVLQKSTSQLPQIHPVVPMMIEEARNSQNLDAFWSEVVGKLTNAPTAEKHYLLLHMIKTAFMHFDSLSFLMKETYVDQVIYPLVKTGSPVCAQARLFVSTLEGLPESKAKDVLRFVLSHPKGYRFDLMTKTSLVAKTLQKASPSVVQWYSGKLQKRLEVLRTTFTDPQAEEGHMKFDTIILEQLANLAHMSNMGGELEFRRGICEYIGSTYFSGDARISKRPNIQALLKALAPSGKTNSLVESADNITAVLNIYLNMEKRHSSFRHEKKLRSAQKVLIKLMKCEKDADACLALRILVSYLALNYALGIQTDVTIVDDVMSSAKAFIGGRQEGDEVEWIDLVIEALVSALSIENALFRAMILAALNLLHKHISTDSLTILLEVFRGDERIEDLTQLEEVDSGDESEDDDSDEEEDEDAGTLDQDESGSDMNFRDAAFRNQLSAVLGVTASDDEGPEIEATDEEMMKLDKAISAAFSARFKSLSSSNNKENKKKELAALHFEMKCLQILDSYVKSSSVCLGHIVLICRSLIAFATSKRAKNLHRPIVTHIAETLRDVSSLKVTSIRSSDVDLEQMKEFGRFVAEKIRIVYEPELRVALNNLLPFIVKCTKSMGDDDQWYFDVYRELIQTYVEQATTPVAPPLFVRFIEVFNEHCLVVVDAIEVVLVDSCVRKREKRVQLMGLLVAALKLCNPGQVDKKRLKKSLKRLAAAVGSLLEQRNELGFTTNLYVELVDLMRLISKKSHEAELGDLLEGHCDALKTVFKEMSTKNLPSKIKRRLNAVYRQFFPGEHFELDKKQTVKETKKSESSQNNDDNSSPSKRRKPDVNSTAEGVNGNEEDETSKMEQEDEIEEMEE